MSELPADRTDRVVATAVALAGVAIALVVVEVAERLRDRWLWYLP